MVAKDSQFVGRRHVEHLAATLGRLVAVHVRPRVPVRMGARDMRILDQRTDLFFGNAVFQWVPDHSQVLARLLGTLPLGGALAVQMPDNTHEPALMLMEKIAASGPWTAAIAKAKTATGGLLRFAASVE